MKYLIIHSEADNRPTVETIVTIDENTLLGARKALKKFFETKMASLKDVLEDEDPPEDILDYDRKGIEEVSDYWLTLLDSDEKWTGKDNNWYGEISDSFMISDVYVTTGDVNTFTAINIQELLETIKSVTEGV